MRNVENVKSLKEFVMFVKDLCLIVGLVNGEERSGFIFIRNVKGEEVEMILDFSKCKTVKDVDDVFEEKKEEIGVVKKLIKEFTE